MQVGDVLAGRYELLAEIGRGGMGRVLRARDLTLNRDVAIKLLAPHLLGDADAVAALRQEAQQAASVRHPNVVQVLDAVLDDTDQPAIVMEHVDGPSLGEVIPAGGMDVDAALEVLRAVGNGLAAVHDAGIVHRDVAPSNVLLDNDVPRLTDFGIARSATAGGTTTIQGSVRYLAPEQADAAPIGPAADVYGLGCLATTLLTGEPPFSAAHPVAVVNKHLHEPAPDVRERSPDIPAEVAAGIAAALQKDPSDRPGSVRELLELLGLAPDAPVTQPGRITPAPGQPAVETTTVMPTDGASGAGAGVVAGASAGRAAATDREPTRVLDGDVVDTDAPDDVEHDSSRLGGPLLLTAAAILLLAWLAVTSVGGAPDTTPTPPPTPSASPTPASTPSPTPREVEEPADEDPAEEPPSDQGPPDNGRGPDGNGPPGQDRGGRGGGPGRNP